MWHLPNVFISPHIAGITPQYNERAATIFEENFRPLVDSLKRTMAENERRVRERLEFNAGRAMSLEVSLDSLS